MGEDALAGEQFGAKADHKAEHGQAAIPGLGERDETETVIEPLAFRFVTANATGCERLWQGTGVWCLAAFQEIRVKGAHLPAQLDPQSWGATAALPAETPARPERH